MLDSYHQVFKHQPLHHSGSSIRLIRVQEALSPQGYIQCNISNGTTETSSYICLSYVWGQPSLLQTILLDGRTFEVRQNLFNFLAYARTMSSTPGLYWIDAICIDQSNIPERNQQVARMGDIYSKARYVYLWPGQIDNLDAFARLCVTRGKELVESNGHVTREKEDLDRDALQPLRDSVWSQIVHNEYWERAWIVQELFLAREIFIILGARLITFSELYMGLVYGFYGVSEPSILKFRSLRRGDAQLRGKGLMELVKDFYGQKCSIPRDRFYSLFSLCEERKDLVVDYDVPKCDLIFQVLSQSRKKLCLCSTLLAFRTLARESGPRSQQDRGPFIEFECLGLNTWTTSTIAKDDHDADTVRYESAQGYISAIWIVDACGCRMDMRRRFFLSSDTIIRRIRRDTFPCYLPEIENPGRDIKLSEALWEMPLYDPDLATERPEYIRADGFSAKLGADNFTYTVRLGFWAIANWIDGPQRPDLRLTQEAKEKGHGSTFISEEQGICPRSETVTGSRVTYDAYEPGDYDANELDVRIGYGHWDLEAMV